MQSQTTSKRGNTSKSLKSLGRSRSKFFIPRVTFWLVILCILLYPLHLGIFCYQDLTTQPLGLITHLFTHANLPHLFGNMFYLLLVGPMCEKRLGSLKFLVLYILSGFAGSIGFGLFYPDSHLVGASGAISGLVAIYPFVQRTTVGLLLGGLVTGFYFLQNFIQATIALRIAYPGIAFLAHVAGGVMGLVMFCFYKRK